jgi:mRNA interferase MazF
MNRGEVWRMALDPVGQQHERDQRVSGEAVARLVVIISSDALALLPLRIVIPLTAWKSEFSSTPWMVRVPPVLNSGLEAVMAADALQLRAVSTSRLRQRLGSLPEKIVIEITSAVSEVIQP